MTHIFSLFLLACSFVTAALTTADAFGHPGIKETCILSGRCAAKYDAVADDEDDIEDQGGFYYRKNQISVEIFQRCGSRICESHRAKVYTTGYNHGYHKKYCRPSPSYRNRGTFTCYFHSEENTLVVYWPTYKRKFVIKNVNNGMHLKVLLPRYRYVKKYCYQLPSCVPNYPKTIVITEKIQGKSCPSGRLRFPVGSTQDLTKRSLDGRLNNPKAIFNGAVGENMLRLSGNGYADKISELSGSCTAQQKAGSTCPFPKENNGTGSNRPNPRVVSNVLMKQNREIFSRRGQSDLSVYFGQLLDHDADHTAELPRGFQQKKPNDVEVPISVPKGDVIFDPDSTGNKSIPVRRSRFDTCTGSDKCRCPREHINDISAVIDANTVYGQDKNRLNKLRLLKDGLMKMDNGNLPLNTFGLPNANAIGRDPTRLRIAGDNRANVAPTLLALHTLFVREHNRIARLYKKRHPKASDEEIFQHARKIVIAEMQAITLREYAPSIIGRKLPQYKGFNPKVNSGIATEFSHAAFRFGHTQISGTVFRFDKNNKISPYGHFALREGFFRPERVTEEGGIDPVLRGAVKRPSQEIDVKIVDEMRNFLFPKNGLGLDLAAINIQRGRDVGIPDYNTVRKALGLPKVTSFKQITRNRKVATSLKSLYKDVNNLDLWVGGIAEDHVPGSELGPTFEKIFVDQISRMRDGDRFWYERILSRKEINYVNKHTLSRIIQLNTGYNDPPSNVFFASDFCRTVVGHQCVKKRPSKCRNRSYHK
ncbi:peroxinectin A-like isoform X2 [Rhopilema esculentum]|uniref:peroxinectin A-like isoform X1 n=1 Tax=Rhopilema esculentum TaxID=499914 RepID=UPI0031E39C74